MTPLVWTAVGIALGASVLYTSLGLRRPRQRTFLSFGCLMLGVAVFLFCEGCLYHATTVEDAIRAERGQVAAVNVVIACMIVFIPAYTRTRLPRGLLAAYWSALAFAFVANLWLPLSLWYSAPPVLVPATFRGESYTTVQVAPLSIVQYAWSLIPTSLLVVSLGCARKMYVRGERQRAATLAAALLIMLVQAVIDIVRDSVGGTWPYVAEYGVVSWALIMSVQLAYDYRAQSAAIVRAIASVEAHAKHLSSLLQAMHALEHNMEGPLQTLVTGIAQLGHDHVGPMHRAVARLHELRSSITRPDGVD
jgi:hypothetical protein